MNSFGPKTNELITVLEQIIYILNQQNVLFWLERIGRVYELICASDFYGVELLLSFYGGMGSFNDIVLSEQSDEFVILRSKAYELATFLRRNVKFNNKQQ